MSGVKIGVYHRCILIAECNTASEAWDKARTWRGILSPVEVKKVANNSSERVSTDTKRA